MENSNIIGLVLTGGKSSRMGEDKGLLLLEGNTWAELQAEKLHGITTNVYLSVNRTQLKKYSSIFNEDQLVVDSDFNNLNGALRGLLNTHLKHPTSSILVVACDYPFITKSSLEGLKNTEGISILKDDQHDHPLLGHYSVAVLTSLLNKAKQGELDNKSWRSILKEFKVSKIEVLNSKEHQNINTQEEYDFWLEK